VTPINLVVFIEQLAALVVQSVAELKGVIGGSSTKQVNEILADADAKYQEIIANAKSTIGSKSGPSVTS